MKTLSEIFVFLKALGIIKDDVYTTMFEIKNMRDDLVHPIGKLDKIDELDEKPEIPKNLFYRVLSA